MARIRNRATGVVVSASDEVAADLAKYEWEPADEKPAAKRAASKSDK